MWDNHSREYLLGLTSTPCIEVWDTHSIEYWLDVDLTGTPCIVVWAKHSREYWLDLTGTPYIVVWFNDSREYWLDSTGNPCIIVCLKFKVLFNRACQCIQLRNWFFFLTICWGSCPNSWRVECPRPAIILLSRFLNIIINKRSKIFTICSSIGPRSNINLYPVPHALSENLVRELNRFAPR